MPDCLAGDGQTLPGFNIAVASMHKKEQARFLIAPQYGMGERGCPPRIPGGATCKCDERRSGWSHIFAEDILFLVFHLFMVYINKNNELH